MKKIYIIIISVFALSSQTNSQVQFTVIDTNNVSTRLYSTGAISNNFVNGSAAYEVPKGSNTHTLYELSPVWCGVDDNGTIEGSIQTNNVNGSQSGPVSNDYNSAWYNALYEISSMSETEAANHATNWNQMGYTPTTTITT